MKGGVYKMTRIAIERATREAGISWQPTEEQEQAAVIEWTVLMAKFHPELNLIMHIPNGGLNEACN